MDIVAEPDIKVFMDAQSYVAHEASRYKYNMIGIVSLFLLSFVIETLNATIFHFTFNTIVNGFGVALIICYSDTQELLKQRHHGLTREGFWHRAQSAQ